MEPKVELFRFSQDLATLPRRARRSQGGVKYSELIELRIPPSLHLHLHSRFRVRLIDLKRPWRIKPVFVTSDTFPHTSLFIYPQFINLPGYSQPSLWQTLEVTCAVLAKVQLQG